MEEGFLLCLPSAEFGDSAANLDEEVQRGTGPNIELSRFREDKKMALAQDCSQIFTCSYVPLESPSPYCRLLLLKPRQTRLRHAPRQGAVSVEHRWYDI